jgi:hypothetical protein
VPAVREHRDDRTRYRRSDVGGRGERHEVMVPVDDQGRDVEGPQPGTRS